MGQATSVSFQTTIKLFLRLTSQLPFEEDFLESLFSMVLLPNISILCVLKYFNTGEKK